MEQLLSRRRRELIERVTGSVGKGAAKSQNLLKLHAGVQPELIGPGRPQCRMPSSAGSGGLGCLVEGRTSRRELLNPSILLLVLCPPAPAPLASHAPGPPACGPLQCVISEPQNMGGGCTFETLYLLSPQPHHGLSASRLSRRFKRLV